MDEKSKNDLENNKNIEKEIKIGNYIIKKTLGKGTFAKVKLAIQLPKKKMILIVAIGMVLNLMIHLKDIVALLMKSNIIIFMNILQKKS